MAAGEEMQQLQKGEKEQGFLLAVQLVIYLTVVRFLTF